MPLKNKNSKWVNSSWEKNDSFHCIKYVSMDARTNGESVSYLIWKTDKNSFIKAVQNSWPVFLLVNHSSII